MGAKETNNNEEVNRDVKKSPINGVITNNNNGTTTDYELEKDTNKGNEEKKIFCGGISYETTCEDLKNYFNQYGEVVNAQVKFDRITGRSRGFAFVEFATIEACKLALAHREQNINNKQCEIKPAKTRESNLANKKVFVGGLPSDFPEEDLRKHFEQYGKVEEIEWPFDKQTKSRRNFAFVVFEEEEAADRASSTAKQVFGSREVSTTCDVKKAVPQNKRNRIVPGVHIAMRGSFGAPGLRGQAMIANPPAWFAPWSQMGHAVATNYPGSNAPGWSDWYGSQVAAANYYSANGANPATGYGFLAPAAAQANWNAHKHLTDKMANLAVGVPNGYDYQSHQTNTNGSITGGVGQPMQQRQAHHQNGAAPLGNGMRYQQY
jgi:RNA recognition motif-containing protein